MVYETIHHNKLCHVLDCTDGFGDDDDDFDPDPALKADLSIEIF